MDMAERDAEIAELKARIASLEARPANTDLDWVKNSNTWKIAQFASSPGWIKFNVIGVAVIWGIFILGIIIAIIRNP